MPTVVKGSQTYTDLAQIVEAMKPAGVDCTGLAEDTAPSMALVQGRCDSAVYGELVIALHQDTASRDAQASALDEMVQSVVLVGGNWLINMGSDDPATQELLTKVRGELGGSVR